MLNEIETITEQNTETITMSSSAAQAVSRILAERKLEGYSLRVYVAGGGCCGVNFGMALDNNVHTNDTTFQLQGVQLVVDDQSIAYLRGAKIDFVNDPARGAGFIVDSPVKNSESCACGSGAHGEAESEAGGCGCGGSCDCNN
jgi:iron-sulfur cluster assembly accessory protein